MFRILAFLVAIGCVNLLFANNVVGFSNIKVETLPKHISDTIPSHVHDTLTEVVVDTVLRITNLQPYITLAADSILLYQPEINKQGKYFWYLRRKQPGCHYTLKFAENGQQHTIQPPPRFVL